MQTLWIHFMNNLSKHFCNILHKKSKTLLSRDKTVSLLIDETQLKPFFDHKDGTAFKSSEAANSEFLFMISSVFSSFKDVAHALPTHNMSADILYDLILKIVKRLEGIGFTVTAVIADNNSFNRKAMSLFVSSPRHQ